MTGTAKARGATFADAIRLTAHLPGVEQSTSYGTPALKVSGRSFCRMWSPREHNRDGVHDTDVLVVFCDPDWKQPMIESSAGVLFTTPHYDGYGAVLIRLADVSHADLAGYLEDSYLLKAPASQRKQLGRPEEPPAGGG